MPAVGGGHGRGVQRDDVPGVADGGAQAVGEQFVSGDDDPTAGGMSMNWPPTGRVTVTLAMASSGGTE
jgi:hypothetical protein